MPWESLAQGLPKASGGSAEEAAAEPSASQGVTEIFCPASLTSKTVQVLGGGVVPMAVNE